MFGEKSNFFFGTDFWRYTNSIWTILCIELFKTYKMQASALDSFFRKLIPNDANNWDFHLSQYVQTLICE